MRAAQYWARYLKAAGVARIFGHPGTETIELLEAARAEDIEFVLTHHEATAAFAASMTGHLTGVPGICVTTAGPGTTNAATGVAQAWLDRMPMILFTGDHPTGPDQPAHQRLPSDMFSGVSRGIRRVSAESLQHDMPAAFELAMGRPRGPAHVTFPSDQMAVDAGTPPIRLPKPHAPAESPASDLARASALLAGSRRPFILVGLGVPASRAETAFVDFAQALGAPVADTPQGRGAFPTDHLQHVGTFGSHRDAVIRAVAQEADLVIAVGLDSAEFLKPWFIDLPVVVLREEEDDDPSIPAFLSVAGDLGLLLRTLTPSSGVPRWDPAAIESIRARHNPPVALPADAAGSLWPQSVVDILKHFMPNDTVVTVDVGSHKLLMVSRWPVQNPGSFLCSSGLSSMGTGLPFAIAAQLAHPDRPVLAVVGDGGLLMYAGELGTIARLGLPIIIVVMADAALYSIKIKQLRRSYPPVGTEFQGLPVARIANEFGVEAVSVSSREDLSRAIQRALPRTAPFLIEAHIDPEGYEHTQ